MIGDVLLRVRARARRAPHARRLREPRRPDAARPRRRAARPRRRRLRERRRVGLRGLPRRPRDRHLPARTAAPAQPVARRLAARARRSRTPRAAIRRSWSRSTTARGNARTRSPRGAPESAAGASRDGCGDGGEDRGGGALDVVGSSSASSRRRSASPLDPATSCRRASRCRRPGLAARRPGSIPSSSPNRTSTWFRTTSFRISTPSAAAEDRGELPRSLAALSTSSAIPDRPSERIAA